MLRAPNAIPFLDVLPNDLKVGTIVRTPGDFNAFSFDDAYRATGFPVLSLSFRAAVGGLRKDPRPLAGPYPRSSPTFFPKTNCAKRWRHHAGNVRAGNDFDLLAALGTDLPGAVRVLASDGATAAAEDASKDKPKARFSLAGVQMKLSVMKNTGKAGGLTLPMGDEQGQYIAKFPSAAFLGVSENEFAILALAAAIGVNVPEQELVEKSDFEAIPEEFDTLSDGKVLLVKRFDRSAGGERIHIEDFAQVFGVYPSRKYEGAAYHDIASALSAAVSPRAALEFVRRLALTAITSNGDMHLKNWSLIYRGNGDKPELAPIYDLLSTVPYIPADAMALSLGGERSFKVLAGPRWKTFANRARLPEPAVLKTVIEVVERVNAHWWNLPERAVIPKKVL